MGAWNGAWRRFRRRAARGVWQHLFEAVAGDPDFGYVTVDATIVRAHQHGAGGRGGAQAQAVGRSRVGPSTKLHAAVDALGNPVRVLLTPGQRHEMTCAGALAAGLPAGRPTGDAVYDADGLRRGLAGAAAVVPSNPSRARAVPHDRDPYKERHLVECLFAKPKRYRRVATRHEKSAANPLAMVQLASAMIRLK